MSVHWNSLLEAKDLKHERIHIDILERRNFGLFFEIRTVRKKDPVHDFIFHRIPAVIRAVRAAVPRNVAVGA